MRRFGLVGLVQLHLRVRELDPRRLCGPAPSVTASLLVALSDGLLESAYLDGSDAVPMLVKDGVARLLKR